MGLEERERPVVSQPTTPTKATAPNPVSLAAATTSASHRICNSCKHRWPQDGPPPYDPESWCYKFKRGDHLSDQGFCGQYLIEAKSVAPAGRSRICPKCGLRACADRCGVCRDQPLMAQEVPCPDCYGESPSRPTLIYDPSTGELIIQLPNSALNDGRHVSGL